MKLFEFSAPAHIFWNGQDAGKGLVFQEGDYDLLSLACSLATAFQNSEGLLPK